MIDIDQKVVKTIINESACLDSSQIQWSSSRREKKPAGESYQGPFRA